MAIAASQAIEGTVTTVAAAPGCGIRENLAKHYRQKNSPARLEGATVLFIRGAA